ncbi:MAG TPA: hypothetical protein VGN41_06090, partial [Streptosporangiaceae bacterium]
MDSSSDDFTRPEPGGDPTAPHGSFPPGSDPAVAAPPAGHDPAEPEPSDWDVGEPPGEDPFRQGLWLTASAWLPAELLSTGGPAGFGQGGVLDQLSPGPVLGTFLAEKAGGLAGTGVTPGPQGAAPADDGTGPASTGRPQDRPCGETSR